MIRQGFEEWEAEQGQTREQLVCPICGDAWLTPTSKGTARPHAGGKPTEGWDAVRQLRDDIKTLEAELHKVLRSLEAD